MYKYLVCPYYIEFVVYTNKNMKIQQLIVSIYITPKPLLTKNRTK